MDHNVYPVINFNIKYTFCILTYSEESQWCVNDCDNSENYDEQIESPRVNCFTQ